MNENLPTAIPDLQQIQARTLPVPGALGILRAAVEAGLAPCGLARTPALVALDRLIELATSIEQRDCGDALLDSEQQYRIALITIATMPMPDQDNQLSASMRKTALTALAAAAPHPGAL